MAEEKFRANLRRSRAKEGSRKIERRVWKEGVATSIFE